VDVDVSKEMVLRHGPSGPGMLVDRPALGNNSPHCFPHSLPNERSECHNIVVL